MLFTLRVPALFSVLLHRRNKYVFLARIRLFRKSLGSQDSPETLGCEIW